MKDYLLQSIILSNFIFRDYREEILRRWAQFDISQYWKLSEYKKNQIVFSYGDNATKYFIVLKGGLTIIRPKLASKWVQEETRVKELYPGICHIQNQILRDREIEQQNQMKALG